MATAVAAVAMASAAPGVTDQLVGIVEHNSAASTMHAMEPYGAKRWARERFDVFAPSSDRRQPTKRFDRTNQIEKHLSNLRIDYYLCCVVEPTLQPNK